VTRLVRSARLFAEVAKLADEAAHRLEMIVEEWAANIIEHSRAEPGSPIVMRLERDQGVVRATFSDAGIAFDPREVEHEGPNLERGGGAGIALIRNWSEIEACHRRAGRNRLVLRLKS